MMDEPVVFVVDDDAAIRKSVQFLIESVGLNVETYANAEQFLSAYDPERPGCLILDVRMPGMSGLQLQETLAKQRIHLPIIIVTAYGEVPMAVRAVQAGAIDFIEKPFSDQVLLERIRQAIEADRRQREQSATERALAARVARLSPREREVLDLVVDGKQNKEIAGQLGISPKTVEAHRAKLAKKLKTGSRAELIQLGMAARQHRGKP